jgi:hypothetical protein
MGTDALHLIDNDVVDQDLAFGLLKAKELTIFEEPGPCGRVRFTRARRPTMYLYRVYVGGELAGTMHARRQTRDWFHGTGWLVAERFRGLSIAEKLPGHPPSGRVTAAALLMQCYTDDLVSSGIQITSECLNGNVPSWKLSERAGWSLLDVQELDAYAAARGRTIKRTFPVEGGKAVQWEEKADDFDLEKWSANRVYGIKPGAEPFLFVQGVRPGLRDALTTALTVARFGSPLRLAGYRVRRRQELAAAARGERMVEELLERGREQLRTAQPDQAVTTFQGVIELRPRSVRARAYLADALLLKGDAEEAIRVGLEAVRFGPDFGPAHSSLASAYCRTGNYAEAARHLERAMGLGVQPAPELLRDLEARR